MYGIFLYSSSEIVGMGILRPFLPSSVEGKVSSFMHRYTCKCTVQVIGGDY